MPHTVDIETKGLSVLSRQHAVARNFQSDIMEDLLIDQTDMADTPVILGQTIYLDFHILSNEGSNSCI